MTPAELVAWRKTQGLTQQALALLLGVSPVTVARWECRMRGLTPQTQQQLADLMAAMPAKETP